MLRILNNRWKNIRLIRLIIKITVDFCNKKEMLYPWHLTRKDNKKRRNWRQHMRSSGRNTQNLNQESLIKRTPKISSLTFRVILYQTRPSNSTGLTLMKTDLSHSTRMRYSNFPIKNTWYLGHTCFLNFSIFLSPLFPKIIFPGCFQIVLDFFKVSWSLQRWIKLVVGAGDGLKH